MIKPMATMQSGPGAHLKVDDCKAVDAELPLTLKQVDKLYGDRGHPHSVEKSVQLLERAQGGVQAYEVQWRLARSLFFLGQEATSNASKKMFHRSGIAAGKRAVILEAERVEGRFWLGVNLGLFGQSSRGLSAACCLLKAHRQLSKAVELCASYHDAGPLRVLGRIEHKTPWFLGGSRKRSLQHFQRALELAPTNTVTLLYAAELAIDEQMFELALTHIKKIIDGPDNSEWKFEMSRDREIAQTMRARLEERAGLVG